MPSDENTGMDSPIEGTGNEMLPERGLPFDDLDTVDDDILDALSEFDEEDEPRDLTPEELSALLGDSVETVSIEPEMEPAAEIPDSGMGAVYPILTEEDFVEEPGVPAAEPLLLEEESLRGMPAFSAEAFEEPGPARGTTGFVLRPGSSHLESAEDMLAFFVSDAELNELRMRMNQVHDQVVKSVTNVSIANQLLDQIERARNEILAGKSNYEEADRSISEVEVRIEAVKRNSKEQPVAFRIFLYEILWSIALLGGLIWLAPMVRDAILQATGPDALIVFPTLASDLLIITNTGLVGALGGITGAIYALWRHVARYMDFSKDFTMWYITNPVMGMFLGGFTFIVMRAGLISMTAGSGSQEITFPYIIYALAFVVGFQQNVATDLIYRILKAFNLGSDSGAEQVSGQDS